MRSGGDPSFLRLVQDLSIAVLLVLGIYLRERGWLCCTDRLVNA